VAICTKTKKADRHPRCAQVYPASKIFALLVETAHGTRNQKSRAEALSEMAALIERLGLEQVSLASLVTLVLYLVVILCVHVCIDFLQGRDGMHTRAIFCHSVDGHTVKNL
jgi:hypothetical protein